MNPAKIKYNFTALLECTKPKSCFLRRILGLGFFMSKHFLVQVRNGVMTLN